MEDVPVACMRQSSSCCPSDNLGCLPCNFSLARASGTNLASQSSFGATSVSPSRRWRGPALPHGRDNLLAALTIKPKLLAHILLTSEYRWPKSQ